jgi:hypothetical protein
MNESDIKAQQLQSTKQTKTFLKEDVAGSQYQEIEKESLQFEKPKVNP